MNDPQQIRRALGDIRRALDTHPRESLAEILAIVFKEYVVEGGQPIASGGQILDARSDLEGLSFAELVVWLQTHLDVPELALLEVSGADVSVRVNGQPHRLQVRPPAPPPAPVAAPPGMITTTVVRQVAPTAIPAQPAVPQTLAPTPPPAPPATGNVAPAKEDASPSETGTRFSLLEVD